MKLAPGSAFTTIVSKTSGRNALATAADRDVVMLGFRCPCGMGGMYDFASCTGQHSSGATEVKTFVDQKITDGALTVDQLVQNVERTYGGRTVQAAGMKMNIDERKEE